MLSIQAATLLLSSATPAPVVYTLDDVEDAFGITYTPAQRDALRLVPFSEPVLRASVGTHMLFPGCPLSLLDIVGKCADAFYEKTSGWYPDVTQLPRMVVPVRWHLLRMHPVPLSLWKNWDEQCALLDTMDSTPSAALVAFAGMLHCTLTGSTMFNRVFVRTTDAAGEEFRVCVGDFGAGAFDLFGYDDRLRNGYIGLSSERHPTQ